MSDLTLSQIIALIKDGNDLNHLFEHSDEIMDYANRVDEVATDIFNRQDKEFSKGLISLAESLAVSVMLSNGSLGVMESFSLMSDKRITEYSIILIKMAVGISAMEELR